MQQVSKRTIGHENSAVIIQALITPIKLNSTYVIGPHTKSGKFEFQIEK